MKRSLSVSLLTLAGLLTSAAVAAPRLDGGIVANSGSTNTAGYTMKVWSDGSAEIADVKQPQNTRRVSVGSDLAARFLADAKAAKAGGRRAQTCMKSMSFGYRLTVAYHGWMSPDLTCPSGGVLAPLRPDIEALEKAAGLSDRGRIIRLPNEPRRLPPSEAPAPSPSPAGRNIALRP